MGTSLVRYIGSEAATANWGVLKGSAIHRLSIDACHHRELMKCYFNDRAAFDEAIAADSVDQSAVEYLSPVSRDIQLIVQGMNYASHRAEGGVFNKEDKPEEEDENLIFYKAASSISKPNETIVRPKGIQLLDYEIELGFVMKKAITEPVAITEDNVGDYIGALVLANDVSARDAMFGAPAMQWFKGKSQRTFCPLGPVLYLLDKGDIKNIYNMELKLKLNGKLRQDSVTEQLIHKPPATLSEISTFTDLQIGDCVLTGTPGGVLMNLNLKTALAIILNMKNDAKRREKLTQAQLARESFLKPGDILELEIKSRDGTINLGCQRNEIVDG